MGQERIAYFPSLTLTIGSAMHEAKDWSLALSCPACGRLAHVGSELMGSAMRCPYCRAKVVVEPSGLRRLRKPQRKRAKHNRRNKKNCIYPIPKNLQRATPIVCSIGLAACILLLILLTLHGYATSFEESYSLEAAENSFQHAWIGGDCETAKRFVHAEDVARFEHWSEPRRGALLAGFGSNFSGSVTEVQVMTQSANQAEVRVLFEIRGHGQQQFQLWAIVDGQWRLRLP